MTECASVLALESVVCPRAKCFVLSLKRPHMSSVQWSLWHDDPHPYLRQRRLNTGGLMPLHPRTFPFIALLLDFFSLASLALVCCWFFGTLPSLIAVCRIFLFFVHFSCHHGHCLTCLVAKQPFVRGEVREHIILIWLHLLGLHMTQEPLLQCANMFC